MNQREQKATQIYSKTNSIRKVTNNHFIVESQNSDKRYSVEKLRDTDVWVCQCDDFHFRLRTKDNKHCKHIRSCIMLKENISIQNKIEKTEQPQICSKCSSTTIIKIGFGTGKLTRHREPAGSSDAK